MRFSFTLRALAAAMLLASASSYAATYEFMTPVTGLAPSDAASAPDTTPPSTGGDTSGGSNTDTTPPVATSTEDDPEQMDTVTAGDPDVGTEAVTVTSSSSKLNFGTVPKGTASPQKTVTFLLAGAAPGLMYRVTNASIVGVNANQFVLENNCNNLSYYNGTCSMNVTFTPSQSGAAAASISFQITPDGGPMKTVTVALAGTGSNGAVGPVAGISASELDFGSCGTRWIPNPDPEGYGSIITDVIVQRSATVTNNGSTVGNFSNWTASAGFLAPGYPAGLDDPNPGFRYIADSGCSALSPGASCTVNFLCSLSAPYTVAAVYPAGMPTTQKLYLSGTSFDAAPQVQSSANVLNFDRIASPGLGSKSVTIKHYPNGTVFDEVKQLYVPNLETILSWSASISGPFQMTHNCAAPSVGSVAGTGCTVTVHYVPTTQGKHFGSFTLTGDTADTGPKSVTVYLEGRN